jgi:hypothetical protein
MGRRQRRASLIRDCEWDSTRSREFRFSLLAENTALRSATPVFLVNDIAATMEWYGKNLGFECDAVPKSPPHNFCILRRDELVIFLQQLAGYHKPDLYGDREGGVWSAYIRTQGIGALYETLRSRAEVTRDSRAPSPVVWFEIRDPNGYVLVFAERL